MHHHVRGGILARLGVDMKIEIDADIAEQVTAVELARTMANLVDDYEKRKAGARMSIFYKNKTEDLAEIKRHIDAFKLVGLYYGVKL